MDLSGAASHSIGKADPAFVIALAGVIIAAGAVGLVIAVLFLINYSDVLKSPPSPGVSSSILIRAFLIYLVSNLLLQGVAVACVTSSRIESDSLVCLALQSLAILAAFALGMGAFAMMTGHSFRRIGLRLIPPKIALKWGIGGYLAALPFFGAATALTRLLDKTIFRNIQTPEHPLVPFFTDKSAGAFAIVLILGVIIAPLVEEIFFRGVLYGLLRNGMRVWGAAIVSAAIFALVHPLPAYFLPILALGIVFALVREKTGSLVPSMIAHGIHNGIAIIVARLLY